MFDADRPITSSSQDLLGRSTFAKYLARSILEHTIPDSLVIGLYGGWGSGKTSLINLTLEELNYASSNMFDDQRPIILNFSPWSYSGQNQLLFNFFRRLSSELRRSPYLSHKKEIIYLLELYVSFFTKQPVPHALRLKHSFWEQLFKKKILIEENYGWKSGKDLTLIKKRLNTLLSNQQHKIIIFIDNIARLEAEEIKQIFQIVKSIGDFANTVYVLALDRQYVVNALDNILYREGNAYLEKIVQLPFSIPPITQQSLEALLIARLNTVLKIVPRGTWNKNYWSDLYYASIRYFFKNVRDITQYINILGMSYFHVKEVVNPVDFFALTIIEIFAPNVYFGIRDNKDLFTDLMDDVYRLDNKKIAEDKSRCDEILARAQDVPKDLLLSLLLPMFPRLRHLYEPGLSFYHSEAIARKNKRICCPDVFEIYFRLSLSSGEILESEFNSILALTSDEEGFALALLRLNQDERIDKFLNLLDSFGVNKIAPNQIKYVVDALIDSADLFPPGEETGVSFDTPMRVHRILHQLFRRVDQSEERFHLFRHAITKAVNSIYIIIHELIVQTKQHQETEDTFLPIEHRDFTPDQLDKLHKLAVGKIIYWAEIGRLIEHPKLIEILHAWKMWGNTEECRRFVLQATQDDRGLLAFLTSALKEPIDQALEKYEVNPEWQKYLLVIEEFISPKLIEPQVKTLFEDINFEKLREREQLALLIFLDLINARTTKIIPKTSV